MLAEALAAVVIGLAVLAIVLEPVIRGGEGPTPRPAAAPLDLEELEQTRKGQAIAALREIEFDRATGKLSDEDYQALYARYAVEAVAALREEDAGPAAAEGGPVQPAAPDEIETMVAARLRSLHSTPTTSSDLLACPRCGPRPEPDAVFCSSCGDRLPQAGQCSHCGALVRTAGPYCESCGSRVAA
jgi:hypothetical protein